MTLETYYKQGDAQTGRFVSPSNPKAGGAMQIYYDDWEIWNGLPPTFRDD